MLERGRVVSLFERLVASCPLVLSLGRVHVGCVISLLFDLLQRPVLILVALQVIFQFRFIIEF